MTIELPRIQKALTLHQPWAWCISDADKRLENRNWYPRSGVGTAFAVHSGRRPSGAALRNFEVTVDKLREAGVPLPEDPLEEMAFGQIVAVARVIGLSDSDGPPLEYRDWWARGSKGWLLDDVIPLYEPVECKGAQALWTVPENLGAHVNAQLARIEHAARKLDQVAETEEGISERINRNLLRLNAMGDHRVVAGQLADRDLTTAEGALTPFGFSVARALGLEAISPRSAPGSRPT